VKSPRGSRGDPGSHGAAAIGAGAEADDDGDEDVADPELRAMRRVWHDMREQEPPAAGMSALLAAARVQAASMQPQPTWPQRMLAALRRPPVLALATVVVVIGGAMLVTLRIEGVPPAGAPMSAADRAREATGVAPTDDLAAAGAEPPVRGATGRAATVSSSAGSDAAALRHSPVSSPTRGSVAPSPDPAPRARGEVRGEEPANVVHRPPAVTRDPAEGKDQRADATRSSTQHEAAAQEAESPPAPPGAAGAAGALDVDAPVAPDAVAAPAGTGAGPERTADRRRPARGLSEPSRAARGSLYQQCEVAAARGDCATVRRLVEQIASKDPAYRSRLTRDSAVARCLSE
jgi:hypothetical protein